MATKKIPMSSQSNPNAANYVIPASSNSTTRNAYGNYLYAVNPAQPTFTSPSTSGRGGGGGAPGGEQVGGNVNGQFYSAADYDAARRAFENPVTPNFDASMSLLEGLIPGAESTAAGIEATARQSGATNRASAEQQFGDQEAVLAGSRGTQYQVQENAANESRRAYNEITQGLQGRYGGSTGTGQFASEIVGAQTQRNMAGYQKTLQDNLAQIDQKIAQVKDVARIAYQQIEDGVQERVSQAKQWLNQTISGIRQNQSMIQSHKSDLAFNAMQQYQTFLQNVELQRQQQQSAITQQEQGATQTLSARKMETQNIVSSFVPQGYQAQGGTYGTSVGNQQGSRFGGGAPAQVLAPNSFGTPQGREDEYGNPNPYIA